VNGFLTIALPLLLAVFTRTAFIFPSLGPAAYLFFFYLSREAPGHGTPS
jgi:hypothetical protein